MRMNQNNRVRAISFHPRGPLAFVGEKDDREKLPRGKKTPKLDQDTREGNEMRNAFAEKGTLQKRFFGRICPSMLFT
jgi:hypothetical protein